jgi:RNA polymerase sigma-70 factor (ECF subfamily)
MSIVANKARDWIRHERLRRGMAAKMQPEVENQVPADPDLERVREGLAALEPEQRALLRRYYLEGRSVGEIASELSIPPGTVKSRLFTARDQLRRRLEEP